MGLCSFSVLRSWWLLMGYTHDYRGAIEELCYVLLHIQYVPSLLGLAISRLSTSQ